MIQGKLFNISSPKYFEYFRQCLNYWKDLRNFKLKLSSLLLWIRSVNQTKVLSRGPGKIPAYPLVGYFCFLTAHWIIQTSQSHPPAGASHPFDTTKSAFHSPWLFILFLNATPMCSCMARSILLSWAMNICD